MNAASNATTDLIQPEFILGASEINRASDTIADKGAKLDDFIQYTALSVLNHVQLHGDVTVANKLFTSMHKGARKTALVEFLIKYGKLAIETDRTKAKVNPFCYDKTKVTNIEGARAKPWYEHKKDPDPIDTLDVHAMIAMLVKRIERDESKGGKVEGDNVTLLTDLKLLAARPVAAAQPAPATVQ